MKRAIKIAGVILLTLLALVLIGASVIYFGGIPSYDPGKVTLNVEVTPERVEKGQKMARVMCMECHMGESGKLTGKLLNDIPPTFGKIYSRNITQDQTHGIGTWTDGELYYLLRTGIKRDGQYIPPYMVKFPNASEEDIYSIIAWLRSDKPALEASQENPPASEPSFLTKFLSRVAFKPLPLPSSPIHDPDTTNAIAHGKYLSTAVYQCHNCHSKDFKTNNDMEPEKSEGYFGGGNVLIGMQGEHVLSANITFDETGLAAYSLEDFSTVLRSGKKKDGTQMRYPMVPHPDFTDLEVKAIYEYLKSVPKIKNKIGA